MMPESRKLHLVYAIYEAHSGGAVLSVTRHQAEYLVDCGHSVTLVTNSRGVNWNGVTTHVVSSCDSAGWKLLHRLAEAFSCRLPRSLGQYSLRKVVDQLRFPHSVSQVLAQLAQTHPIDGVVACQHVLALGLKRLRQQRGIRFVIMSHGDIFEHPPGSFSRAMTWLYQHGARVTSKAADGIITVNSRLRERAISLGTSPDRVHVLYNGVALNEIEGDTGMRPESSPAFQILAVGRLSVEKGIDVLLRAVALLPATGIALRIAGVGGEDKHLAALVETLKLQDRVTFLGAIPRNQLADYYRSSDLVAIPSRSEAMPLVALEALLCGRPIVATRVGGLPEVIDDGVNGILVSPDNPQELSAAIRRLRGDANLRRQLSANAVIRAHDFAWPSLLTRFEELMLHHFQPEVSDQPDFTQKPATKQPRTVAIGHDD